MRELVVGEVLKPQGIRGEIKVKPYTDSAEDFTCFKRVFLDGEEYKVLSVRCALGLAYLNLRGVPDRNAAELLRGKKITIPRAEAPALPEGRYYIADLLGLNIVTEKGEKLGVLSDIRQAATDIYTLSSEGKDILFPAAEGVVLEVDLEGNKLVVSKQRFKEVAAF